MLWAQRGLLMAIVGVVSAVAVRAVLRRTRRHRATATDLASLWVGGIETMVDVPKVGTLSLAPAASAADSRASFARFGGVPEALGGVAFALTAFDPPGVSRTREANGEANVALWAALEALEARPKRAWRAFGCDLDEGWREDGFVLAYADAAAAAAARPGVLAAAKAFDQGAIYEYHERDGALLRRTLGAAMADLDETTFMRYVSYEDLAARSALVALPWAGPGDGGVI